MSVSWLKGFASGIGLCVVLGALSALIIVFTPVFNTTASKPHNVLVALAVHRTLISDVRGRAHERAPRPPTSADIVAGGIIYRAHCTACHGGPGLARAAWTRGLNPTPPYLLDASRRWSAPQLHFIIAQGVKMTAMPAWGTELSDAQVWQLVAYLEALPREPPDAFNGDTQPSLQAPPAALPSAHVPGACTRRVRHNLICEHHLPSR